MAKQNLISGLALFVFGVTMLVYVIPNEIVEGGDYTISPALLPKICAIGITALSAVLLVQSALALRREKAGADLEGDQRPTPWGPALIALGAVVAATVIFRYVHPAPAAFLLVLSLMLYMGERRWLPLAGLPLALVVLGYLLFYEVLGIVVR